MVSRQHQGLSAVFQPYRCRNEIGMELVTFNQGHRYSPVTESRTFEAVTEGLQVFVSLEDYCRWAVNRSK